MQDNIEFMNQMEQDIFVWNPEENNTNTVSEEEGWNTVQKVHIHQIWEDY